MPQSLSFLLVHIVFSTKNRSPLLREELRKKLFVYLATVARDNRCECYRVGGVADHVHLALRISRTTHVSELVKQLKVNSSVWVKDNFSNSAKFAWQRGYGAFSVGPADREALVHYIDMQEQHHRKISFQDEFRAFLNKYEIEFDEQYVWD